MTCDVFNELICFIKDKYDINTASFVKNGGKFRNLPHGHTLKTHLFVLAKSWIRLKIEIFWCLPVFDWSDLLLNDRMTQFRPKLLRYGPKLLRYRPQAHSDIC